MRLSTEARQAIGFAEQLPGTALMVYGVAWCLVGNPLGVPIALAGVLISLDGTSRNAPTANKELGKGLIERFRSRRTRPQ